ncbi:hypothetical protein GCM10009606_31630 [Nocardioides aquiterrae]|uniref:Uncharacterized protein n=2 Tax=Nocardioides aquiterrae TaxID=203799 RepID=A0ABP4F3N1_9ACTN
MVVEVPAGGPELESELESADPGILKKTEAGRFVAVRRGAATLVLTGSFCTKPDCPLATVTVS